MIYTECLRRRQAFGSHVFMRSLQNLRLLFKNELMRLWAEQVSSSVFSAWLSAGLALSLPDLSMARCSLQQGDKPQVSPPPPVCSLQDMELQVQLPGSDVQGLSDHEEPEFFANLCQSHHEPLVHLLSEFWLILKSVMNKVYWQVCSLTRRPHPQIYKISKSVSLSISTQTGC